MTTGETITAPLLITARLRLRFGRIMQTPPVTRLLLERTEPNPGPEGGCIGFTLEEIAKETGLTFRQVRSRWERGMKWLKRMLRS